jgi:DNA-binding NarL/FixJ family response regulator
VIVPWRPPVSSGGQITVTLTPREADVLSRVCTGLTNPAIGELMNVTEDTVKSHVKHVLHKMGADTRSRALALVFTGAVRIQVDDKTRRS